MTDKFVFSEKTDDENLLHADSVKTLGEEIVAFVAQRIRDNNPGADPDKALCFGCAESAISNAATQLRTEALEQGGITAEYFEDLMVDNIDRLQDAVDVVERRRFAQLFEDSPVMRLVTSFAGRISSTPSI